MHWSGRSSFNAARKRAPGVSDAMTATILPALKARGTLLHECFHALGEVGASEAGEICLLDRVEVALGWILQGLDEAALHRRERQRRVPGYVFAPRPNFA